VRKDLLYPGAVLRIRIGDTDPYQDAMILLLTSVSKCFLFLGSRERKDQSGQREGVCCQGGG
jgi:hypothetical protein